MPKTELDGLPVVEVPDSEEITVAVKADGPPRSRHQRRHCDCPTAAARGRWCARVQAWSVDPARR